jgi:indolepyruvate ferredoxin oxidoreductase alpha subunit
MSKLIEQKEGVECLFMGNEAIARGALEAGVSVACGYPGTPSSEIIENLSKVAKEGDLYVEWSANEKVAMEVAAAASFAGMRSLCAMKQNGVHVASDFLLHLAASGTRGGMILVFCEDPGALSSVNEVESRYFAPMIEIPLLEPADFQEAKDMTRWAFELSEEIKSIVMVRSVTRLSHGSGNVIFGKLPDTKRQAEFKCDGPILDPDTGLVFSAPVVYKHQLQQEKIKRAEEIFERSPFNTYEGPEKPEVLLITSSICYLYCREAINLLGVEDRVGVLKFGATWPLPPSFLKRHLSLTDKILMVEEVRPFLEERVKILAAGMATETGVKTFYGKETGHFPSVGELNPDLVVSALGKILGINSYVGMPADYEKKAEALASTKIPHRDLTFCPGCPHRASLWSIHNALQMDGRRGFVCGDIGCYSMAILSPAGGFGVMKTLHSMGSGTGIAGGFGKFGQFGMEQPVLTVCGDSTFYHAVIPALINAVHHRANMILIVLDNGGTAMTGFQPHPGLTVNAMGEEAPSVDIARICEAIGVKVEIRDPFDLEETRKAINCFLEEEGGVRVLILRQICGLSPEKKAVKRYEVRIDEALCLGENCGCNRLCTRIFRCPGINWDGQKKKARIDDVICAGCGVCSSVCPAGAIKREEAA